MVEAKNKQHTESHIISANENLTPGPAILKVNGTKLNVKLGWFREERITHQTVHLDMLLKLDTPPIACHTDELHDTIDYHALVDKIRKRCSKKDYKLIEALAAEVASGIHEFTKAVSYLEVTIHKLNPPVDGLSDVSFTYTEHSRNA